MKNKDLTALPEVEKSIEILLECMRLAGWEDDNAVHFARAALDKLNKRPFNDDMLKSFMLEN